MLFKLANKNIKKSFKDYAIYFFTLVFAVAMFYTFNSLDAQTSMSALTSSTRSTLEALVRVISYLSVFVAVILGFLIVYANNFLIKRRKKEFGLYLTLGMSKRKVSFILVLETLLVGIISLGIGLLVGVFLSQLLSLLTIKMFEANLSAYKFVFSITALKQTIIDFGIIYLLVILFDTFSITRFKLIDLIMASHKNEKIRLKNNFLIFLTFVLAIGLIGYGYYLLFHNAFLDNDANKMITMIVSGSLGTLFLFYSLSGMMLKLIKRMPNVYYHGLNCFVLKQVNNKINTTVISNTVISLMLMLTIAILATAISLSNVSNNSLKSNNLTDFTIFNSNDYTYDNDDNTVTANNGESRSKQIVNDKDFNNYVKEYAQFDTYVNSEITNGKILTEDGKKELVQKLGGNIDVIENGTVPVISESAYDEIMKVTKQEDKIVDISDNQYLLLCNVDMLIDKFNDFYSHGGAISFDNSTLYPGSSKVVDTAVENSNMDNNSGIIVISDNIINNNLSKSAVDANGFQSFTEEIIGNYVNNNNADEFDQNFRNYIKNLNFGVAISTKVDMKNDSTSITVLMTFVGLYLGITFAIASATVLAIGQLSESSDNKDRYNAIRNLGADNRELNKALFKQIAIAFGFPLLVGVIHSLVGLKEINRLVNLLGAVDVTQSIILVTLFIVVLYGGYFMITYLTSKRLIKK